jgi:hypothetical protein
MNQQRPRGRTHPANFGRPGSLPLPLEQVIPANQLRVPPVPDLHPSRVSIFDRVPALPVLRHQTSGSALADQLEQTPWWISYQQPGARPRQSVFLPSLMFVAFANHP